MQKTADTSADDDGKGRVPACASRRFLLLVEWTVSLCAHEGKVLRGERERERAEDHKGGVELRPIV